jgi:hypothetical protein
MDPDAPRVELRDVFADCALAELRDTFARIKAHQRMTTEQVERLAEVFAALDTWLASGGGLPGAWVSLTRLPGQR